MFPPKIHTISASGKNGVQQPEEGSLLMDLLC